MKVFNQSIVITGNASFDLDRLEAIGDMFKREIGREGGNVSAVTVQRSNDELPNGLKIDVFMEAEIWSPDGAFRFNNLVREFTVEGLDPLVAFYRRSAAIGEINNHLLRGLTSMSDRLATGDYVPDATQWTVPQYIDQTLADIIEILPNTTAGR